MRGHVIPILLFALLPATTVLAADLSDKDREAINAATMAFAKAANAGDFAAVAATYTEDAMLLPPGSDAITGREEIQAHLESYPEISDFMLENTEVVGMGEGMAYVIGTYSMTLHAPGADPVTDHGKYMEIRVKQKDGSWLTYRDMYNSSVPMP